MSDLNFEQLLSAQGKEYKDAPEFGDDWMPPDGEYLVIFGETTTGVYTKDDAPVGWWKVALRIEDPSKPDMIGKEFPMFLRTSCLGLVKSVAKKISREDMPPDSLQEASAIILASAGEVGMVEVKTNAKTGYQNVNLKEIYDSQVEEDEVADAPDTAVDGGGQAVESGVETGDTVPERG